MYFVSINTTVVGILNTKKTFLMSDINRPIRPTFVKNISVIATSIGKQRFKTIYVIFELVDIYFETPDVVAMKTKPPN